MDYNEVYQEFEKVLQELSKLTDKPVEDIKKELHESNDLEDLLSRMLKDE